ncbi:MAG: hypothetical protein WCS37_01355, partial [Chloroflexota bacterium]
MDTRINNRREANSPQTREIKPDNADKREPEAEPNLKVIQRYLKTDPRRLTPDNIMALQRTVGNQAVLRLIAKHRQEDGTKESGVVQRTKGGGFFSHLMGGKKEPLSDASITDPAKSVSSDFLKFLNNAKNGFDQEEKIINFLREYSSFPLEGPINDKEKLAQLFASNYFLSAFKDNISLDQFKTKLSVIQKRGSARIIVDELFKAQLHLLHQMVDSACWKYNNANGLKHLATPAKTTGDVFAENKVAPTAFTDENATAVQDKWNKGGQNSVDKITYGVGGAAYEGVFKGQKTVDNDRLAQVAKPGIPEVAPKFAQRAVAVYKLDQLLQTNVIAKTDFGVHSGKFGIVTEMIKGEAGAKYVGGLSARRNTPSYRQLSPDQRQVLDRLLAKLRVLGILAALSDEHGGNFMIVKDDAGKIVDLKAFDNDVAFGKNYTDINLGDFSIFAPQEVNMAFEKELVDAVLGLESQAVVDTLQGLLSQEEIDATLERLKKLQSYMGGVKQNLPKASADGKPRPVLIGGHRAPGASPDSEQGSAKPPTNRHGSKHGRHGTKHPSHSA